MSFEFRDTENADLSTLTGRQQKILDNWIKTFGVEDAAIQATPNPLNAESLQYSFSAALGDRYLSAAPSPEEWKLDFTPKIKLQLNRDKSGGGCG